LQAISNYMKYIPVIILFSFLLLSCEDDAKLRQAETLRTEKMNDSILKIISNNWKFDIPPATPKVAERIAQWNDWQQFKAELAQKPTGNIVAYRQKTKNLVNKADNLKNSIPEFFNKPQVRSRMGVLVTKIKSLYTYMGIEVVPDKKVTEILREITRETAAIQYQFDELVRISEIQKEFGEEEMIRALDTTRMANPDAMQPEPAATQPPLLLKPKNN